MALTSEQETHHLRTRLLCLQQRRSLHCSHLRPAERAVGRRRGAGAEVARKAGGAGRWPRRTRRPAIGGGTVSVWT